ncbi:MAG: extracellular solute-binding protein [Microthrixaceae bacterium]
MDPSARRVPFRTLVPAAVLVLGALLAASCSSGDGEGGETLVIYSGRTEELVQPLLDRFAEESGIDIEVRYGDSADLALVIDQEGDKGRADVFFSQSPGAVGFLTSQDRLAKLPQDVLDLVPADDRSKNGTWVGVSARARVLVYNPDLMAESELPASVLDLTDPQYRGKVGVAPTNGSFIDFISGLRTEIGDDGAAAWLKGMADNDSPTYANNNATLEAVDRGEIPMGLVNHYYLVKARQENPDISAENHFFPAEDEGSLLLVSAVGVTATSTHTEAAEQFVEFLLSPESQQYFADQTYEFPLVDGVEPAGDLPPLDELPVRRLDLDTLGGELTSSIEMIRESGIQR